MTGITESERIGPLPLGVGDGARVFYAALHGYAAENDVYYDAHEVEMIRQLVLAKDRLDVLDAMRADLDALATSYGDDPELRLAVTRDRLSIMREQRQQAATLGRQVGQLRLPVGLADAAGGRESMTTQRARAAVQARWGRASGGS